MSFYIIISGPLGVGKSTISKRLAKILDAEYVPIDPILEKHGLDKVEEGAEGISTKNFIKADNIILPKIKEKMKKGKNVIFDACFYQKEHIKHISKNLKYPHYVFTLKAPLKICIERDRKRRKNLGKDAATAVHYLVSKFDYGIVINTKDKNVNQTIKEILSYLSIN